jgi:uncharacterized membrane protein YedE/YeeE
VKEPIIVGFIGVVFGFTLSRIGFTSWDEIHKMFTFSDLRLLLTFAIAVTLLTISWIVVARATGATWSPRRVHPGTVVGGVLFGAGWALSGACPSIALVQLGEGQLGAGLTLIGIVAGNWLYSVVHERYFRWSAASCVDA